MLLNKSHYIKIYGKDSIELYNNIIWLIETLNIKFEIKSVNKYKFLISLKQFTINYITVKYYFKVKKLREPH